MSDEHKQCNACGSSPKDRQNYVARNPEEKIPMDFTQCQFCESEKCCMSDMGDDVECLSCDKGEGDD